MNVNLSELPEQTAPLALLFHNGAINFVNDRFPHVMEISPTQTRAVADLMTRDGQWETFRANPSFMALFRLVFPEEHVLPEAHASSGVRHVAGMIVLLASAQRLGLKPFVRYPEAYLHPKAQLGLADLFLTIRGDFTVRT
jgi:hypothetical protein